MSVLVLTPPRKALTWATVPVMVIDDVPVPADGRAGVAGGRGDGAFADGQRDGHRARARVDVGDREAGALERERRLLGRRRTLAGVMTAPGASLTAVMLMVAVSCAISAPPPVLPLSLTARVSVVVADGVSELLV